MASQKKQQKQLNAKQSSQIRILQSQINSIFKTFSRVLKYINNGGKDQNKLISYNDNAVSALDLFGANCEMYSHQQSKKVLMAGWAYFDSKRQSLENPDQKILSEWLLYMDAALAEKQLPELQMTEQTIQIGRQNALDRMPNILSKLIGSQHKTRRMVDDAKQNTERYQQKDEVMIQNAQERYQQMQQNVKVPTQNAMYRFSGGAQDKKFGSAIFTKSMPQYNDQKDADNDVPINDLNNLNINAPKQYPNAIITQNMPNKTLVYKNNNNQTVAVPIPYPCEILQPVKQNNFEGFKVRLAAPYRQIGTILHISCLERDPTKVKQFEENFSVKGGSLGYSSIAQRERENQIQWQ